MTVDELLDDIAKSIGRRKSAVDEYRIALEAAEQRLTSEIEEYEYWNRIAIDHRNAQADRDNRAFKFID